MFTKSNPHGAPAKSFRANRPLLAGLVLIGLGLSTGAQAQLTFFDKPPSAAELRRALLGGSQQPRTVAPAPRTRSIRPAGTRTRGIVWKNQGGVPANVAQPTPAAKTAATPVYSQVKPDNAGPAAGMPINFARGSARIDLNSLGFIETVVEVMRSDPSINLVIEGHTDSTGSYKRNMLLSWDRAIGVYRVLVETYGIEPTRLQPFGKGPTEPMPGTAPADGSNRRVQFRLNG